jgi:FtsZ-interacting cell division protein ZipA
MNSLQLGLIGVGVLVLAVVGLVSWWQLRRRPNESAVEQPLVATKRPELVAEPRVNTDTAQRSNDNADIVVRGERREVYAPDTVSQYGEPTFSPHGVTATDVSPVREPIVASSTPLIATPTPRVEPTRRVEVPEVVEHYDSDLAPTSVVENVSSSSAAVPSSSAAATPFDERLHVHALLFGQSGQPVDVMPFLRVTGRAAAWGRLFRQSPWEAIDPAQPTGAVQSLYLALPIASRGGPVTREEFETWKSEVSIAAANQNCVAQFEGFTAAAERAVELDSFLAAVDCIPIIYLLKKDGAQWSGTRLRGTLEANGFRLQTDGRFAYHEVESEEAIFYAVDGYERAFTPERLRSEAITAFRLVMEAALLRNPVQRFDVYRQTLRALSKLLDAELRDSSGTVIGDTEFAALRAQVQTASDALTDAGIVPGSPAALSLFS